MYDDDYATCEETYATLRIYPGEVAPERVTERLGLDPSETQRTTRAGRPLNGWFLSTEGAVQSRDLRSHLDWLLDRLEGSGAALRELVQAGAKVDVSCYWLSAGGHGGPTLTPRQMARLAELQLDCWFDVYFAD